jgi:hypothetical protein
MHIHLHDHPCAHIAKLRHTLATSMLPMLMQSGPFHSCVHSGLSTLPSSADGAVDRCLHILPKVTCLAWLS